MAKPYQKIERFRFVVELFDFECSVFLLGITFPDKLFSGRGGQARLVTRMPGAPSVSINYSLNPTRHFNSY